MNKQIDTQISSRFAGSPVLIGKGQEQWLANILPGLEREFANLQTKASESMEDDSDFWGKDSWASYFRPYRVQNGTLTIPVRGMLLHDFPYALGSWATGYAYIKKAVERGLADPEVVRIVFHINSGGGEVAGNFDLVDWLYSKRGEKPTTALIDEHAYSAAYNIASAASQRVLPRSGGVGGVGVVTTHVDASKAYDNYGYKVTFIYAGDHKVDGNPYESLPEPVKNRIQTRIDGLYGIFVSSVARNLGLDEQKVRDTEALTYNADEALALGFIDKVSPIEEALAELEEYGLSANPGDIVMSETPKEQEVAQISQVDLENARAEGRKEGASAERERIQAILGSDEAKARTSLASHLALSTDQSVEMATGILANSPEEGNQGTTTASAFERAMATGNPEVTSEGEQSEENAQNAENPLVAAGMATGVLHKQEK